MEKQPGPTGGPAAPPQTTRGEHPVFICYRQLDGKRFARWIYNALVESLKARGDDTLVYFDQAAPATSDWTAIHRPALERACCLLVILTPGLYAELDDDWVHKELDWWLAHRKVTPILVDTTGEGERWIPRKIKSRWPLAQRVDLDPELWVQANEEELEQIRAQVGQQILGAMRGSRFDVAAEDFERVRRLRRAATVAAILAVAAGLAYLGYMQTGRYQIETILKSAPVRVVAEKYQTDLYSKLADRDYLRALATFRPESARRAAQQIVDLDARSGALISIAEGRVEAGHHAEAGEALAQAARTARGIEDPYSEIKALISVAEAQENANLTAEAGKTLEQTLRTAREITDSRLKTMVFQLIAEGQAKVGQAVEADRTAQQITDPYSKIVALVSVAEGRVPASHMAEAGKALEQAERSAQEITDPESRAQALLAIAAGQENAGQFTEAERTVEKITNASLKINALYGIIGEEAKAGFTYQKWGGVQQCKADDWIVRNGGDVHTVDRETFERTYRQVGAGTYVKITLVRAEVARESGCVQTKEGATHYHAGDYLVFNEQHGSDAYAVSAERFEAMYERGE
jgi:hypothetical protein